ncbi:MAG: hypothetical protein RLZZ206_464, partial [Cyanobacteriota bacterium]
PQPAAVGQAARRASWDHGGAIGRVFHAPSQAGAWYPHGRPGSTTAGYRDVDGGTLPARKVCIWLDPVPSISRSAQRGLIGTQVLQWARVGHKFMGVTEDA